MKNYEKADTGRKAILFARRSRIYKQVFIPAPVACAWLFTLADAARADCVATCNGGSTSTDALDCPPFAQFECDTFCDSFCGELGIDTCECGPQPAVPTLSEWAVIGMTLLLLTGGTIVFFRKRGAETRVV